MTQPSSPQGPELPLPLKERIDALCLEFENAWQRGEAPDLAGYVSRIEAVARPELLRELVVLDATYRRLNGAPWDRQSYTRAYPQYADSIREAFEQLQRLDAQGSFQSGTVLGRYTIERRLGSGSFATVYEALDCELKRRVAIKCLRRDREATEADSRRMIEEARTVARMSHPGIVPVYDVLRFGSDVCIVMERLGERSLKDVLKEGPIAPQRACLLAAAICDALSHAHQLGFVHRDLKPGNILLDEEGNPHIADFGLAVHEAHVERRRGELAGSLAYMAPEQIGGNDAPPDARADLWAVGVILYEMLSGRRPFERPEILAQVEAIQTSEPEPLSHGNSAVPPAVEAICRRCLNKAPQQRYPSAAELGADLRKAAAQQNSPAVQGAWISRVGFGQGVGVGAGLGLAILSIVWLIAPRQVWPTAQDSTDEMHEKLQAIALAFHLHHDAFGMFSPPAVGDTASRGSGLSWRVHLLPYLNQQPLYEQFHFDEPWDSPHNRGLLDQMPDIYRTGESVGSYTRFQVVTGKEALFGPGRRPRLVDIRDGPGNTVLALVVGPDRAVPWTKPDELVLDTNAPLSALGTLPNSTVECVLADASLLTLPRQAAAESLGALATPRGEEPIDCEALRRTYGPHGKSNLLQQPHVHEMLARRRNDRNRLRRIALAMHNFHDIYHQFPPPKDPSHVDEQGRPKLSWRVHLLPYLEHEALYRQFKLDESWDSPHNLTLSEAMPAIYRELDDSPDSTQTRIVLLAGPQTPFADHASLRIRDFADGTTHTILVIRAGHDRAVPWTKPQDLQFDPALPVASLGRFLEPDFLFVTADGAVHGLKTTVPDELFLPLATHRGGETISPGLQDYGFR